MQEYDKILDRVETQGQKDLVRAYRKLYASYIKLRKLTIVAIVIVSLGCAAGLYAQSHESDQRTKEFCTLTGKRIDDRTNQYTQTLKYFKSPAGQENTPFNDYIKRVSTPQLIRQIQQDQKEYPATCRDYFKIKKFQG